MLIELAFGIRVVGDDASVPVYGHGGIAGHVTGQRNVGSLMESHVFELCQHVWCMRWSSSCNGKFNF